MKIIGIIGTAIISLLFGIAGPVYAQHEGEKQDHPKQQETQPTQQKPAQQHTQQPQQNRQQQHAQPQQRPQPAQQQSRQQQARPAQQQAQQQPQQNRQQPHAQPQQRPQPAQQQSRQGQARPAQQQAQQPQQNRQQQHAQQQRQQPNQQQSRQSQARPAQQQTQQQAQQRRGNNQPQRTQEQQRIRRSAWDGHRSQHWDTDHRNWQQRGGYRGYRIPDDRFRGYFGSGHGFRIGGLPFLVVGGYPRFQYDGYWLSLVDPWPESWGNDWYDNDDVYVAYDNGYYLYDRRYPGTGIAISISR